MHFYAFEHQTFELQSGRDLYGSVAKEEAGHATGLCCIALRAPYVWEVPDDPQASPGRRVGLGRSSSRRSVSLAGGWGAGGGVIGSGALGGSLPSTGAAMRASS